MRSQPRIVCVIPSFRRGLNETFLFYLGCYSVSYPALHVYLPTFLDSLFISPVTGPIDYSETSVATNLLPVTSQKSDHVKQPALQRIAYSGFISRTPAEVIYVESSQ